MLEQIKLKLKKKKKIKFKYEARDISINFIVAQNCSMLNPWPLFTKP